MGFSFAGIVGPPAASLADGVVASQGVRFGRGNELIVAEDHGKYWDQLAHGNMYIATTLTAGIALIVSATTGNHPTIWNPNGSGFNAGFAKLTAARVSGTDAPGAWYWMSTLSAGSAINATGGPIITFTNVVPVNALAGSAKNSAMKWSPAISTYTNAPVFYAPAGITMFTGTVAAVIAEIQLSIDYDEAMGVAPNAALSLCTQVATSTALYALSLHYAETPV